MKENNAKNSIVLYTPTLSGGVGKVIVHLAQEMHEQGVSVAVWTTSDGEYANELVDIPLVYLAHGRVIASLWPLMRQLRSEKPEALFSASFHANCLAIIAKVLTFSQTKVIVVEHTALNTALNTLHPLSRLLYRLLIRLCYKRAYKLAAVSKGVAKDMAACAGLPLEQVTVIYNPVLRSRDLAQDQPRPSHSFFASPQPIILAAGRLSPEKDYLNLLHAYSAVAQGSDARLIMLGEGPERENLEKEIAKLGLADRVSLPGHVENPYPFFAHSDVFVLSSVREGLPTVLIEALAYGAKVVSTDAPSGPRAILADGTYGALVPVGDTSALAKALEKVLHENGPTITVQDLSQYQQETAVQKYLALLTNDLQ